jgi:ribosome-associated toxin RatA of RatAB toxin-antitoxin module
MNLYSTPLGSWRAHAGRLLAAAAVSLCAALPGAQLAATVDLASSPELTVQETHGTYSVTARFDVPHSPSVALDVLSDYEDIPRFMPDVRTSTVLERGPGRLLVAQEAVSQFLLFSRKVHLVLEVIEEGNSIRFTDRSRKSFHHYRGSWHAMRTENGAAITYELVAKPAFDVPEFILKRLLRRDSGEMIHRLRLEMAARAER